MTLQSLSSTFLTSSPSNPILPLVKYTTTGCSGVAGRAWQALRPMLMRCSAVATTPTTTAEDEAPGAARRSANFQPTIWTPDFLESLAASRPPMEEKQWKKAEELEEDVRKMIADPKQPPLAQLIFIDDVERLGLGYRFEDDIVKALGSLTGARVSELMAAKENSLRATALSFRLLRKHGFHVSQDEFKRFKDSNNNAFNSTLINDIEGLLDLYEASFFAFRGEDLLEEAREFAITSLTNLLPKITEEGGFIADNVARSLDLALHHRFPRLEARQYIDVYPKKKDSKTVLLELAKVDFDRVQAIHQKDLQEMSRWWTRTALANKLSFARDRLMESFFWAVGMSYEPQNSDCRKAITKAFVFITIIDDIYDVYGSVEELELFTKAVERWDVDAIDDLPDYMQLTFLALYNAVNEEGYEALKQKGVNSIPLFRKAWEDLCKAFLVEAKWCHNAETPPFKEYLDNAWISVSGTVMLVHAYFLVSPEITQEQVDLFYKYHDIVRLPSMIFRLSNDLRTSEAELERGETFKSIPCLMKAGASYDEACKHISNLIDESWKALNEVQVADIPFSKNFIWTAINLGRIAQCTYQYGDGHGAPDDRTKNRVMSLLVEQVQ